MSNTQAKQLLYKILKPITVLLLSLVILYPFVFNTFRNNKYDKQQGLQGQQKLFLGQVLSSQKQFYHLCIDTEQGLAVYSSKHFNKKNIIWSSNSNNDTQIKNKLQQQFRPQLKLTTSSLQLVSDQGIVQSFNFNNNNNNLDDVKLMIQDNANLVVKNISKGTVLWNNGVSVN